MHTLTAASGDTGSIIAGFAIWLAIIGSYFVPAIVALIRRAPNAGSVVVIDLLLGWTVIGWIVALAMACRSKPPQYVQPDQWDQFRPPPGWNQPGYQQPQPMSFPPPPPAPGNRQ